MNRLLLSEFQAIDQYSHLIDEYKSHNSIIDKGNTLRARFDVILRMAVDSLRNGEPSPADTAGFKCMIDILVNPNSIDDREKDLNQRLDDARWLFNNKLAHPYKKTKSKGAQKKLFNKNDYEYCLKAITDLLVFLSSTPIPPQLLVARNTLDYKPIKIANKLHIILMVELYDQIENISEGSIFIQKFNEMLLEKEKLKLDNLYFSLITYSPQLVIIPNIDSVKLYREGNYSKSPEDDALKAALMLCEESIELTSSDDFKPWLMWICRNPNKPSDYCHDKVQKWINEKTIGFYPMSLRQETKKRFASIWPNCGPKDLNSSLIGNFFKSILETVQKMFLKEEYI